MMEDQQIELKSEYLDEDYSEETTRHQRKTTKIKIKKQTEPKLGKYSLSAEDFEDEPQGTEADFELYEVVEESASKINAGDVGGNTTHDDDYAEDEAEEDEAVEDEEVEDEEVEDEADCEDQNETYIIENKKEKTEESDVGDEEEPDEELAIEQESQCRGIRALARQNKRLQDRHDTLTQRFTQLESNLQTLHPTMPTTKILWPMTDIDALKSLEERLRTEQGMEDMLKKKFKSGNHKSLNSFINTNLKALFYHAGRFTWTGEAASNAKHGKETHKAQGLLCVQALVDSCEDVFGECAQNITSAIAERLIRMNEAKHRLEIKAAGGCSKKLFTGQLASIPVNKATSNQPGSLKKSTDERKSIAAPPRVSAINIKARGGTSAGSPASGIPASGIPASKIAARGETSAAIPTSSPVSNIKARGGTSADNPASGIPASKASSKQPGSLKKSIAAPPRVSAINIKARGGTSAGNPASGIPSSKIAARGETSAAIPTSSPVSADNPASGIPASKASSKQPGSLKKSTDERKSIAAPPRVSAINIKARGGTSAGSPASGIPASGIPASGIPASGIPASGIPASKIAARGETSAAIPTSSPVSNIKARGGTSASQPNSNALSYHHGSGRKRKSSYTGEPNYVTARGGTSVGHSSSIIMAGNVFVPGGVSYPTHEIPTKKPPIKFYGINVIPNDRIAVCGGTSAGTITAQEETSASRPASGVSPELMFVTIPGGQRVSYAFPRNESNTAS
ncbi:mucin-19-like isoform X2 [Culex pipiens pallens]|uniref:mucin-19-like isoform X2 n=1 Tax=Culex pipiens pallens TaxID=42434 RepID=UPI0019534739|nr:mucin-19-like isoform X2 [Culex pipiens pallens]